MTEYADLIAAFKAKGGTVQKVETGARAMDARQMYAMAHGNDTQRARALANTPEALAAAAEARHHAEHDAYSAARMDGWSQGAALDYARGAGRTR